MIRPDPHIVFDRVITDRRPRPMQLYRMISALVMQGVAVLREQDFRYAQPDSRIGFRRNSRRLAIRSGLGIKHPLIEHRTQTVGHHRIALNGIIRFQRIRH